MPQCLSATYSTSTHAAAVIELMHSRGCLEGLLTTTVVPCCHQRAGGSPEQFASDAFRPSLRMFFVKPAFLLLCATTVAGRTRLQATATVTADISRYLLTSSTVLCSTQQGHQQRRSGRNRPIAQVLRERSGITCISAKDVSCTEYSKKRCSGGADTEACVSGRESPRSRFQRPETRRDGTRKPIREGSRTSESNSERYGASNSRSYRGERSSSSSAGRTKRNDIAGSKTHSLDSTGTSSGAPSSYNKDMVSHHHTINRSALRNTGNSRGVACHDRNGNRTRESNAPSFVSSRQCGGRVSSRTVTPALSAEGLVHGRWHRDHEDDKLSATVALDTTTRENCFDFVVTKKSAADAVSPCRAWRKRHTFQLPAGDSLKVSTSTPGVGQQQTDFLSFLSLFPSFGTRTYPRAVVTVAALEVKKTSGLTGDTPWRQRPWSHSVSSRLAGIRSSAFRFQSS